MNDRDREDLPPEAMSALEELSDDALDALIEANDVAALAERLQLDDEEAKAILTALRGFDETSARHANAALDGFLATVATPEAPPANDEPSLWLRWSRDLALPLAAAASLTFAIWQTDILGGGEPVVPLPAFTVDAKALGRVSSKGVLPDRSLLKWNEGTYFHVRFVPAEPRPDATAQVFLRTAGEVFPLDMTADNRQDGLHVYGQVGVDFSVPKLGTYELLVVLTSKRDRIEKADVATLARATPETEGRRLYWYDVELF